MLQFLYCQMDNRHGADATPNRTKTAQRHFKYAVRRFQHAANEVGPGAKDAAPKWTRRHVRGGATQTPSTGGTTSLTPPISKSYTPRNHDRAARQ